MVISAVRNSKVYRLPHNKENTVNIPKYFKRSRFSELKYKPLPLLVGFVLQDLGEVFLP